VIKLFTPQQTRKGLPLDTAFIIGQMRVLQGSVELISFLDTAFKNSLEISERVDLLLIRKAHLHGKCTPWREYGFEVGSGLRSPIFRVDTF